MRQPAERKHRVSGFTARHLAAIACLVLALFTLAAPAAERRGGTDFDHLRTGFPLTGAHTRVECESCHVRGVFKGTPTQCALCHTKGSRLANTSKPSNHIQTTAACETCHKSTISFAGARFSHTGVAPRTCATCHNGANPQVLGKPGKHMQTTASCDSCHRTAAWLPASAGALPTGHRPVLAGTACSTCHANSGGMGGGMGGGGSYAFTHPRVTSGCASCHNGTYATGKSTSHAVTAQPCETCHKNTTSFVGATFSHTGVVPGSCATCHNGSTATGKPSKHVQTTASCDTCHRTTAWIPATFSHTGVVPGSCATCHNGSTATGKPSNHVQTTAVCDTCHRTTAWIPATFSHTGVAPGSCATCHNGTTATGKSGTHLVTSRSCDACHTTTPPWTTVRYTHTSPNYKIHNAGVTCKGCHTTNNEVIAWKFGAYAPDCAGCHAGNFKAGDHKKTVTPTTILYTAAELKNCAGSCHEYTDNTFTTIKKTLSGKHKSTDGGF